ncbi:Uncharacterised protein [Mycobacteroides abscessus subsp. abscessus]|nr:Uncharacterised protein [Mycobacteroides abscessus subsp. abscessus]
MLGDIEDCPVRIEDLSFCLPDQAFPHILEGIFHRIKGSYVFFR